MPGVQSKVVIITGAASGLGKAGAQLFAAQGARVVAVDMVAPALEDVVADIKRAGHEAVAIPADVRVAPQMKAMVERAVQAYGRIDILWNNAAVLQTPFSFVEDIAEEEWDRVVDTNLKGVFLGFKYVVPHMKRQGGGDIVSSASIAGLKGQLPGISSYFASKGGLVNFTKAMATELGPFNIRVNAVAIGSMPTPLVANTKLSPGLELTPTSFGKLTDATRAQQPIEVARLVLFMVSEGIGPLHGAIIPYDGGWSAR